MLTDRHIRARAGETISFDAGTYPEGASGLLHLEAAGHGGELLVNGQHAAVESSARVHRPGHCPDRCVALWGFLIDGRKRHSVLGPTWASNRRSQPPVTTEIHCTEMNSHRALRRHRETSTNTMVPLPQSLLLLHFLQPAMSRRRRRRCHQPSAPPPRWRNYTRIGSNRRIGSRSR